MLSSSPSAPLTEVPLHAGLTELISMRYGPPGPEPAAGGDGWFLRRYELLDETWIEVDVYRSEDGLHGYLYIVDKPGYNMAVVHAFDRGGQFIDLLADTSNPRSLALATRCPTAATLARTRLIRTDRWTWGLSQHPIFGAHLLTFGPTRLGGRLTQDQFLWAVESQLGLEPLVDDLVFLAEVATPTPVAQPAPAAAGPGTLSTVAGVAEDVGKIASAAGAVLSFLGSFG